MGILDAPASDKNNRILKTFEVVQPAPIGTHAGIYDRVTNVYNLKPSHLRRTRARLGRAKAGTGDCKIAGVGHSQMAGTGATIGSTGILEQIRTMLDNAGFTAGGTGLCTPHHGSGLDPRWSLGAGWAVFGGIASSNSTNSNPAVFTSDKAGTIVDVWFLKTSGSSVYDVIIDGGAPTTVTPTGTNKLYRHRVTGLANTTHTVSIARNSGTSFLHGVDVHSGTGVRLFNAGIAGGTSNGGNSQYYSPANSAGNGYDDNDGGLHSGYNADLIFIGPFWTNDYGTGISAATFKTNMQANINAAKLTSNGSAYAADIVLLTDIRGYDGTVLDGYWNAMYELADENDLPLVDLMDRWPPTLTVANAYGLKSDGLHPNAAGYVDWAQAIVRGLALL